tara:strand:+ start:225 stop:401 length:177 start_codon:yes stop_codon:yes gene_type:complete
MACTKCKKTKKYSLGGKVMPKYSNNFRNIEEGRVLKDGGSCGGGKVYHGSMFRRTRNE